MNRATGRPPLRVVMAALLAPAIGIGILISLTRGLDGGIASLPNLLALLTVTGSVLGPATGVVLFARRAGASDGWALLLGALGLLLTVGGYLVVWLALALADCGQQDPPCLY